MKQNNIKEEQTYYKVINYETVTGLSFVSGSSYILLSKEELTTLLDKVREKMLDDFEFAIRCSLREGDTTCSREVLETHIKSIKEEK